MLDDARACGGEASGSGQLDKAKGLFVAACRRPIGTLHAKSCMGCAQAMYRTTPETARSYSKRLSVWIPSLRIGLDAVLSGTLAVAAATGPRIQLIQEARGSGASERPGSRLPMLCNRSETLEEFHINETNDSRRRSAAAARWPARPTPASCTAARPGAQGPRPNPRPSCRRCRHCRPRSGTVWMPSSKPAKTCSQFPIPFKDTVLTSEADAYQQKGDGSRPRSLPSRPSPPTPRRPCHPHAGRHSVHAHGEQPRQGREAHQGRSQRPQAIELVAARRTPQVRRGVDGYKKQLTAQARTISVLFSRSRKSLGSAAATFRTLSQARRSRPTKCIWPTRCYKAAAREAVAVCDQDPPSPTSTANSVGG